MIPVVIPFHKNKEQLKKCEVALKDQLVELIIVDDSDTEAGFTETVNKGLRRCFGKHSYAIILNQDCYLKEGAVDVMRSFMDKHPNCAIGGIKQLSSGNEDQIIHGGTYECYPTGRHEGGKVSKGDCSVTKQVPWVNGACMIVRLDALVDIGLMDKNYVMFGSDADWSYTARLRGWETWYIAEAVCIHEQGASKSMNEKMGKVFEADMRFFRDKWLSNECYREMSMEIFT